MIFIDFLIFLPLGILYSIKEEQGWGLTLVTISFIIVFVLTSVIGVSQQLSAIF